MEDTPAFVLADPVSPKTVIAPRESLSEPRLDQASPIPYMGVSPEQVADVNASAAPGEAAVDAAAGEVGSDAAGE